MFAKIENNQVVQWPIYSLAAEFPNTSFPFPMTEDALPEGYVIVTDVIPPEAGHNQKVVATQPVQQDSKWVQGWDLVDLLPEEIAERREYQSNQMRMQRNIKLTQSDWTQISDAPGNKEAWAEYRQALRDITSQEGFPFNVQWPSEPS